MAGHTIPLEALGRSPIDHTTVLRSLAMNSVDQIATPVHDSFVHAESSTASDVSHSSRAVVWVQQFARHLQGLGSTGNFDVLLYLGERFHPIYQALDPSSVADAVWAKWPIDTMRRVAVPAAIGVDVVTRD